MEEPEPLVGFAGMERTINPDSRTSVSRRSLAVLEPPSRAEAATASWSGRIGPAPASGSERIGLALAGGSERIGLAPATVSTASTGLSCVCHSPGSSAPGS